MILILLYSHWRNDKDARRKTSLTKYVPLSLLRGFEKVVWGSTVRGNWRPNRNSNILTPTLMAVNVLQHCSPRGPLCWVICNILSATSLHPNSIGNILTPTLMAVNVLQHCSPRGPLCWVICNILSATSLHPNSIGGPFGLVWLSLLHLVYNSVGTATVTWLLSWLSYIIVQRPLDVWNGLIDRHPAEITVMQFTGHSLPVHQSMSVSWALPCPISSAKSTHAISFDYWPLECVTSFRCITL